MNIRYSQLANLILVVLSLSLAGCLSGGDSSDTNNNNPPPPGVPPSNAAPTISGNPAGAVKVGDSYSFTPTASDPDGDTMTFDIANRPIWASFDTSTGTVSGTPTLGNIGTFSDIRVSVTDGTDTASLSGFSVEVTQNATASTTLTWSAPTQNEDGTTLTNLAGYRIYYGTSSRNYSNEIQIDNPSISSYVVDNLTPDTYYFAATAFNSAGEESRLSGEAVRTLN